MSDLRAAARPATAAIRDGRPALRRDGPLIKGVALAYLAAFVYHSTAHEVRGITPPLTYWLGWTLQVAAVVVVVLVLRGHRLAVPALLVVSTATWVGLAAVHLPPAWGPMSEPWRHGHGISPLWWGSLYATLAAGLVTSVMVLWVLRRERAMNRRWSDIS